MSKPVVVAKHPVPEWIISYDDHIRREESIVRIFGSPTIEDAIAEAHRSLDAETTDWYTITGVELKGKTLLDVDEP